MKTLKTAIAAVLIATGTVATFAFTNTNENVLNKQADTVYHWFDGDNYLGQRTTAEQQSQCGPVGANECAKAYSSIALDEDGNKIPMGTYQDTTSRQ